MDELIDLSANRVDLTDEERDLLVLLLGSIAGGGGVNPLHLISRQLDGQDIKLRQFVDKLYSALVENRPQKVS